jgi:hypothetical protein
MYVGVCWIQLAKDSVQWWGDLNRVMTLRGP